MPLCRCLYKGSLFYMTEHTWVFWDLYYTESCIVKEAADLLPEYIESQDDHQLFPRPDKVTDEVKWSKRNEVIIKFPHWERINTHCCGLLSTTLGLESYRVETGFCLREEDWGKSHGAEITTVKYFWLWFSFYLYPFHNMEVLLTYWICYWFP